MKLKSNFFFIRQKKTLFLFSNSSHLTYLMVILYLINIYIEKRKRVSERESQKSLSCYFALKISKLKSNKKNIYIGIILKDIKY